MDGEVGGWVASFVLSIRRSIILTAWFLWMEKWYFGGVKSEDRFVEEGLDSSQTKY